MFRDYPYVGILRFIYVDVIIDSWHVYLDYSGLYSVATVEVYIHVYWFLNFECGVASISWINVLFACLIALIKIGVLQECH